ncbi:hypothetical protein GQ53DRAFT_759691 [Thozetella sp. PMI_491]|nr:hypothetical protein GQ53DRAFT_759691 [Thozetella sp. PMI_491]
MRFSLLSSAALTVLVSVVAAGPVVLNICAINGGCTNTLIYTSDFGSDDGFYDLPAPYAGHLYYLKNADGNYYATRCTMGGSRGPLSITLLVGQAITDTSTNNLSFTTWVKCCLYTQWRIYSTRNLTRKGKFKLH